MRDPRGQAGHAGENAGLIDLDATALSSTETSATPVLIVAYRTAATPTLLDAVRARVRRGPCSFTLLVPRPYWDPDTEETALVLELAIPLLEEAAGGHVEAIVGDPDPLNAVKQALGQRHFEEAIVSTLPERVSRWLRRDLPRRVAELDLPVTVVTARQSDREITRRA
jgi:hypothetical protein